MSDQVCNRRPRKFAFDVTKKDLPQFPTLLMRERLLP